MSYNTDKVTWKCYPTNIESFDSVNYPDVDSVLESKKSLYEDINQIDNNPNPTNIPDNVSSVNNFKSPTNTEPIRTPSKISLEPIIITTDVQPGIIMPGNLTTTTQTSNSLLYADNTDNSLYNDVFLKSSSTSNIGSNNNDSIILVSDQNTYSAIVTETDEDSMKISNLLSTKKSKSKRKDYKNLFMHKVMMYISIALIIYLIYLLFV